MWHYEVSGKNVLTQWFSCRRKTRERPLIGDRRPPSPLCGIQPDAWPAHYTTDLLDLLNVLGLLVDLEPAAFALLERICAGPLLDGEALRARGVFAEAPMPRPKGASESSGSDLFSAHEAELKTGTVEAIKKQLGLKDK